jgi:hypothetical protein
MKQYGKSNRVYKKSLFNYLIKFWPPSSLLEVAFLEERLFNWWSTKNLKNLLKMLMWTHEKFQGLQGLNTSVSFGHFSLDMHYTNMDNCLLFFKVNFLVT